MKLKEFFTAKKIGGIALYTFIILPGIFFLFTGFQWIVAPGSAASSLNMPLLSGAGLGSQVGDIGGLFLGMGLLTIGGVTLKKPDWLFATALLLSCVAFYRFMSFILQDATLIMQSIVFEIVLAAWLFTASRIMAKKESGNE